MSIPKLFVTILEQEKSNAFKQLSDEIKKRKPEFFHCKLNKFEEISEINFLFGDMFYELKYKFFDFSLTTTNHSTKYTNINNYRTFGCRSFIDDIHKILNERNLFLEKQSLSLSVPNVEIKQLNKGKNKI